MSAITHRIEKVFVEVNTGSLESANFIKNNISRFLETHVFPKLEQTLDEFNQAGRVARINSLNLDVVAPRNDYFGSLEIEITKQFSEKIESLTRPSEIKLHKEFVNEGIEIIGKEKSREEIFFYFLENGHLPWFGTEQDVTEFLQPLNRGKSFEDPAFFKRFTHLLKSDKTITDRFILQFDVETITTFLQKLNPGFRKIEPRFSAVYKELSVSVQKLMLRFYLEIFARYKPAILLQTARRLAVLLHNEMQGKNQKIKENFLMKLTEMVTEMDYPRETDKKKLVEVFLGVFSEKIVQSEKTKKITDEVHTDNNGKDFFDKKTDEIAVLNAGLVLLNPFLKPFFKAVNLLDKKGQIKNSKTQLAVQTLHFLASGEEDFFEGNLILEKFLCGVPLKNPVARESLLSEKIKEECQHLLNETIRQWPALKNSSAEGLQQMFLQRNGKLIQQDRNFKLIVERKAQDLLLDKLNWNISLVKIPWRKELLYVEWK